MNLLNTHLKCFHYTRHFRNINPISQSLPSSKYVQHPTFKEKLISNFWVLSPYFQRSTISDLRYHFYPAWVGGLFLLISYIRICLLPSEYKRDPSICTNLKQYFLHSNVKDPSGQDCVFSFNLI